MVRRARIDDLPRLARLKTAAAERVCLQGASPARHQQWVRGLSDPSRLWGEVEDPEGCYLVASSERAPEELRGSVLIKASEASGELLISGLYCAQARSGLGSFLLKETLQYAKSQAEEHSQPQTILVEVMRGNQRAREFFCARGFQLSGERPSLRVEGWMLDQLRLQIQGEPE